MASDSQRIERMQQKQAAKEAAKQAAHDRRVKDEMRIATKQKGK